MLEIKWFFLYRKFAFSLCDYVIYIIKRNQQDRQRLKLFFHWNTQYINSVNRLTLLSTMHSSRDINLSNVMQSINCGTVELCGIAVVISSTQNHKIHNIKSVLQLTGSTRSLLSFHFPLLGNSGDIQLFNYGTIALWSRGNPPALAQQMRRDTVKE